jgi:hypothetical protein
MFMMLVVSLVIGSDSHRSFDPQTGDDVFYMPSNRESDVVPAKVVAATPDRIRLAVFFKTRVEFMWVDREERPGVRGHWQRSPHWKDGAFERTGR